MRAYITKAVAVCLAAVSPATAFISISKAPLVTKATSLQMSSTPDRVVMKPLPKVYVYDHCPFCVRVRYALGMKNVKHEIVFFANDDVDTPTSMVGKKVAPIFEVPGKIDPMPESMDIVKLIDADPAFGPTGLFKPASGREDIKAWQKSVAATNRIHQRPRYMRTYLPEFATQDGKNAFVFNHQLAPYEKPAWKADLTDEKRWALYDEAFEQSQGLIDETNKALLELEPMIHCPDCCTEGGLSLDDVDLFSRLRSLTIVKGVVLPGKVGAYMENMAKKADVPLYTPIAC